MTSSNIPNLQGESVFNYDINICALQSFESFSILYKDYQLGEPNSWNRNMLPISLFGINDFLNIDIKNSSLELIPSYLRYIFFSL